MSQTPYGYPPQQYTQAPPQPYAQPGYAPAPQYPQAPPQQYAQPGYAPQPMAAPAAPPPIASGTLDDFYSQPSAAGGPGISWKGKPEGTSYAGIVSGKCRVQQDTDFDTGRPLFQRDQVTPKWVMLIPLSQVQTNAQGPLEFPDGEAVFYVRGQARDELARAMNEAHCSGEPAEGAGFSVTLTQRKPNRKGNPSNIVAIRYLPPGGVPHQATAEPSGTGAPSPAPVQQAAPAPQPQAQTEAPPAWAAPQPNPQQVPLAQPVQQQAPAYQPPQEQQVAPAAPQPPAGLSPEQQQLLATLTGGQAPAGQ